MNPTKYYSDKQEKLIANTLDWEQVSGSGARPFHYGDVISDEWLAECKTHTKPGHDIYFGNDIWTKIQKEAVFHQRRPVLIVDDGSQKLENTWCLFHKHSLDLSEYSLYDVTDIKSKNINFKSHILGDMYKGLDGNEVKGFRWNEKVIVIVPFSMFEEMIS